MPVIGATTAVQTAIENIISRPTNPELVNRIILRYVNQVISNRPVDVDFQTAHNNFINMVRTSPQGDLHAPFPNSPQITPIDRLATVYRLNQISSLFNGMINNRDNAEGFRQLFQRLEAIVGRDGALEISVHTDRPIRRVPN